MTERNRQISELLHGLLEVLEDACLRLERLLGQPQPENSEDAFLGLKWVSGKGERLGDFEVAFKRDNRLEGWQHAFNILRQYNAVIGRPFHLPNYQYRYWIYRLYDDRIFRKKLDVKGDDCRG